MLLLLLFAYAASSSAAFLLRRPLYLRLGAILLHAFASGAITAVVATPGGRTRAPQVVRARMKLCHHPVFIPSTGHGLQIITL